MNARLKGLPLLVLGFLSLANCEEKLTDLKSVGVICQILTTDVRVGGALDVLFVVQNNGKDFIEMRGTGDLDGFCITAAREDGTAVPQTASKRLQEARPNRGGLSLNHMNLAPGARFLAVLRLSEHYDISLPGKYTFTIEYTGLSSTFNHISVVRTFAVVVKGPELRADTPEIARILQEKRPALEVPYEAGGQPKSDAGEKKTKGGAGEER